MTEPYPGISEYETLLSNARRGDSLKAKGRFNWYLATQSFFREPEEITQKTILKKMAFAYSWMPTIPKWPIEEINNWDKIIIDLKSFKENPDSGILREILENLVPIVNNSITGTSKVLNFLYQHDLPIIDSRVIYNWNMFFKDKFKLDGKNRKEGYIKYFEAMNAWVLNCKTMDIPPSINDIERALFKWNGGVKSEDI